MLGIMFWLSILTMMSLASRRVPFQRIRASDELPSSNDPFGDLMGCGGRWCPDLLVSASV